MDFLKTREVYQRLQDSYSRFLFEKRAMYCLTGDMTYMDDVCSAVLNRDIADSLMDKAQQWKDKLVVRGAGNDYRIIKKIYPDFDFLCFMDNDPAKIGNRIDGKEIISPEEFYAQYADCYVFVNSAAANAEIVAELKAHGIADEKMINFADCYSDICDKQYFDSPIMKPTEHEVFIDGGCYDGGTIRHFVKWCHGRYDKIFSFEPDEANYHRACSLLKENPLPHVNLMDKGLWSERTTLSFANMGSQGSNISEKGGADIQTISIDEAVGVDKPTFIKLDVEGAEYQALLGARKSIMNCHPKLAISVYHKPEDIFELPELILSFDRTYRFYLRHYQLSPNETILYGI